MQNYTTKRRGSIDAIGVSRGVVLMLPMMVSLAVANTTTGISLGSTRIIYPGDAKGGVIYSITNQTEHVYLLQSRVLGGRLSENMTVDTPFIVLPPLTRFSPGEKKTLKILLAQHKLPADRESLFYLTLKAIPSQSTPEPKDKEDEATLGGGDTAIALALQNNLKLFYRPPDLIDMESQERAEKLQFIQQGSQLTLKNPTPYYVTLGALRVNSVAVEMGNNKMIAPFSSAHYVLPNKMGQQVYWRILDDEGGLTPELVRSLPLSPR